MTNNPGFISIILPFWRAIPGCECLYHYQTKTNMDDRITRFFEKLQKTDGREIVYKRGNQSVTLIGLVSHVSEERLSNDNFALFHETKMFAFCWRELRFGQCPIYPTEGDTIETETKTYKLIEMDNGGFWEFSESGENIIELKGSRTA